MASYAVAFWHCSWQDFARNQKLVLAGDTAVKLMGGIEGQGGFIFPSTRVYS